MQDERGTTHLDGGKPSLLGVLMNDHDMATQFDAAIKLEHRLTNIEGASQQTHQTLDNLLSRIGEIKGALDERARLLVDSDTRLEGLVQTLATRQEQHEQWHREEHAKESGKAQAMSWLDKALLRGLSGGAAVVGIVTALKEMR
jgi:uncharacterized protein (DUF3084 family)